MARARRVNLKLSREKCTFLRVLDELPYIGYLITKNGVKPDPNKIRVMEMKPPVNSEQIQRFLGHVNYSSKFIPNCSAKCELPRRLISVSKEEFVWGRRLKEGI